MPSGIDLLIEAARFVEMRDGMEAQRKDARITSESGQNRKRKRNNTSSSSALTPNGNMYQNPSVSIPNTLGSSGFGPGFVPERMVSDQSLQLYGNGFGGQRAINYLSQLQPARTPSANVKSGAVAVGSKGSPGNSSLSPGGYRGTNRQVHNNLEKQRRAVLQQSFELVRKVLPEYDPKRKSSNLGVLIRATRFIQTLERRETEYIYDVARLTREKEQLMQRLRQAEAAAEKVKMDDYVSDATSNNSMESFAGSLEFNYPLTITAPGSGEESPIDMNSGVYEKASSDNHNNHIGSESDGKGLDLDDNGKYYEAKVCPCQVDSV